MAGAYNFLPSPIRGASRFSAAAIAPRPSRSRSSTAKDRRCSVASGDKDKAVSVRNTRNLAAKMRAQGSKVEEIVYPRLGHSDIMLRARRRLPSSPSPIRADIVRFYREELARIAAEVSFFGRPRGRLCIGDNAPQHCRFVAHCPQHARHWPWQTQTAPIATMVRGATSRISAVSAVVKTSRSLKRQQSESGQLPLFVSGVSAGYARHNRDRYPKPMPSPSAITRTLRNAAGCATVRTP